MGKESKWGKDQDGLLLLPPERVKMGCCCLPPDRVKLTVDSKKETNSRVKMGQKSRSASVIYIPAKCHAFCVIVTHLQRISRCHALKEKCHAI